MAHRSGFGCFAMACIFWCAVFGTVGVGMLARHCHISTTTVASAGVVFGQLLTYVWICLSRQFGHKLASITALAICIVAVILHASARKAEYEYLVVPATGLSMLSLALIWPTVRDYLIREYVTRQIAELKHSGEKEWKDILPKE